MHKEIRDTQHGEAAREPETVPISQTRERALTGQGCVAARSAGIAALRTSRYKCRMVPPSFIPQYWPGPSASFPEGPGWEHELKLDGYRKPSSISLDGEALVVDKHGKPSF